MALPTRSAAPRRFPQSVPQSPSSAQRPSFHGSPYTLPKIPLLCAVPQSAFCPPSSAQRHIPQSAPKITTRSTAMEGNQFGDGSRHGLQITRPSFCPSIRQWRSSPLPLSPSACPLPLPLPLAPSAAPLPTSSAVQGKQQSTRSSLQGTRASPFDPSLQGKAPVHRPHPMEEIHASTSSPKSTLHGKHVLAQIHASTLDGIRVGVVDRQNPLLTSGPFHPQRSPSILGALPLSPHFHPLPYVTRTIWEAHHLLPLPQVESFLFINPNGEHRQGCHPSFILLSLS